MNDYPVREKTAEDFIREINELKIECALYELKYRLFREENYRHEASLETDKKALETGKLRETKTYIDLDFYEYTVFGNYKHYTVYYNFYDLIDLFTHITIKDVEELFYNLGYRHIK